MAFRPRLLNIDEALEAVLDGDSDDFSSDKDSDLVSDPDIADYNIDMGVHYVHYTQLDHGYYGNIESEGPLVCPLVCHGNQYPTNRNDQIRVPSKSIGHYLYNDV